MRLYESVLEKQVARHAAPVQYGAFEQYLTILSNTFPNAQDISLSLNHNRSNTVSSQSQSESRADIFADQSYSVQQPSQQQQQPQIYRMYFFHFVLWLIQPDQLR